MTRPERLLLGPSLLALLPACLSLLALLRAAPALGQYIYLDTNGDGVHTSADVIQPSGVTAMDLWLRTDTNRDGTPATCDTGDGELTINSYEFVLHAVNGTIAWGPVTNRMAGFSTLVAPVFDGVDLHAGAYGASSPPGTYRLATIEASPASGTPDILIADHTPLGGSFLTAFGSQCSGLNFSNNLEYGFDWFDGDGAAYGGTPNSIPTLDPIADLGVFEAEVLEQTVTARDADGDPLEFTKHSGPSFLSVTTVDPGSGVATGLIRVAPGYGDAGTTTASLVASDGIASAQAEFRVSVFDRNRAPTLDQPADMAIGVGQVARQDLTATDPDGGRLEFLLVSGQDFITVTTAEPVSPARGLVTVEPEAYDAGEHIVTVAASDGLARSERSFDLHVFGSFQNASLLCRPYDMTVVAGQPAEQTVMATSSVPGPVAFSLVDTPPFVSITPQSSLTNPQTAVLRALPSAADLGAHSATVEVNDGGEPVRATCRITVVAAPTPPAVKPEILTSSFRSYDVCDIPQGAVLADLNRDGRLDLVTANYGCGLSVLMGIGGGQFADRRDVVVGGNPKGVELADLDHDGDLDAAVATGFGDQIEILAGDGTGSFQRVGGLPAGPDAAYVAIADLNQDGILDLAGADEIRNTVSIYLGTGGLAFGERRIYAAGSAPCYTSVADWTGDGIPDVAAANEISNAVTLHAGNGDGTFAPAVFLATGPGPSSVRPGDFDEDGHPDLAASDFHARFATVLFGDGQGGFPRRVDLEVGQSPWSLTVDDVNGDGHLDLVSANTGADDVGVVLGNGDGTFRNVQRAGAGSIPRFVTSGDLDGDGRKDLVVANEIGGTVSLLMNRGEGVFGSSRGLEGQPTVDLAAGDVTGDGAVDLISVTDDWATLVRPGLGGGQFGAPVPLAPGPQARGGMKLADMNADGVLDLLLPLDSDSWALYAGGPAFLQSTPALVGDAGRAFGFAVGDWNGDSKPDVAMIGPEPRLTTLDGDGALGFSNRRDYPFGEFVTFLTAGDWDGDGIKDLAVSHGRSVSVLWGDGAGFTTGPTQSLFLEATGLGSGDSDGDGHDELFVTEEGSGGGIGIFRKGQHARVVIHEWTSREAAPSRRIYPGGSASRWPWLADLTGDGLLDLIVIQAGANAVGVMPGLGGGAFGVSQDYGVSPLPFRLAVADWDGDGRLDVATSNYRLNAVTLLRNVGGGVAAIAARVFATPPDGTLRLVAARPTACLHVEPVQSSFPLEEADPASIRLSRADSDAAPIAPVPAKTPALGDADRNGIPDLASCFGRDGLRALFADVRGARRIPVVLTGSLRDGRTFRGEMEWNVVGAPGGPPLVLVAPNPSNPSAVLRFTLERAGRLRVTVHDVRGRVVARLADTKTAIAGEHRFRIGAGAGVGARGAELASGVYFYRVETDAGVRSGRFTVLK